MKTAQTIEIQKGVSYAKVAERIKLFREECPNGLIETDPRIEGDMIMFKAHILKDKSKPESAEATGHAIGPNKGQKAFEKIESIAVGRALAMLGYMASGEIASSEEMEEFQEYIEDKKQEQLLTHQSNIAKIGTMEELKAYYQEHKGDGKEFDALVKARKDQLTNTPAK